MVYVTREKLIETNGIYKKLGKNKSIVKLKNSYDYTRANIIGKILVNSRGERLGKVLDVIANVSEPYALILQVNDINEGDKLFIELPSRGRRR